MKAAVFMALALLAGAVSAQDGDTTDGYNYDATTPEVVEVPEAKAEDFATPTDCSTICGGIGKALLVNVARTCSRFKNEQPTPKVWAACRAGFLAAQTEVCKEVCATKKPYSNNAISRIVCSKHKQTLPKPTMYNSCVTGAHDGHTKANSHTMEALGISTNSRDEL